MTISLIFLAGGTGSRMGASVPKQFIPLNGKPVALYSFELFASCPDISEIVVVAKTDYQYFFSPKHPSLRFALPGPSRQVSVFNGLQKCNPKADLILIHDSARPFLELQDLRALIQAGLRVGAAALATPVASTIKQSDKQRRVEKTLDRSQLWEIQTPQALYPEVMRRGFAKIDELQIEVTDDVALAEQIGHPVELVIGNPRNIKLTTPFDLALSETILRGRCLATN